MSRLRHRLTNCLRHGCMSLLQLVVCSGHKYQLVEQSHDSSVEETTQMTEINKLCKERDISDENWTDLLTETQRRSLVTDRHLFLVSEHIGEGWETVGIRLGLSCVKVNKCKMDQSSCQMQIFTMLEKWRKKNGRRATVEVLVSVLQQCLYVCTLDMFEIVTILQQSVY